MGRIWLAIRSFFSILFQGKLPDDGLIVLGLTRRSASATKSMQTGAAPAVRATDGAANGSVHCPLGRRGTAVAVDVLPRDRYERIDQRAVMVAAPCHVKDPYTRAITACETDPL